ncbi:uncharacterized protein LOC123689047 [Harmonia axyridis]|uniref:uncharacterized protein LOC123689047 n=1 Tax=Harmonia axyridis TaxID=115357 RepID=UPI001E27919E|nr:uncharacterized protein LOC123689047 [Harmonia axyridis]
MRSKVLLLVFISMSQNIHCKEVLGSECNPAIKCVNSTSFAFCVRIGSEEKLVAHQNCLEGQRCSSTDGFQPCITDPTTTTSTTKAPTSTTKAPTTTTVSPPNCDQTGLGDFPAAKCNQYYRCSKTLWWWDANLKTCPQKMAFDPTSRKCVLSTDCKLAVK